MNETEKNRAFLKSDRWDEWQQNETDQKLGLNPPASQLPYSEEITPIPLVDPAEMTVGSMPLRQAIARRRSRREYTAEALSLEELSFLLWATQGIDEDAARAFQEWRHTKGGSPTEKSTAAFRTVPSAGARHPFESYLAIKRVDGLRPGLYRYLSMEHGLLPLKEWPEIETRLSDAFGEWVLSSAVLFIWAVVPYRTEWRYTICSHKMIAQESGHICQNLYLASEAIGAGACAIGAYDQVKTDALLDLDGHDQFTIYVAPVGKVTSAEFHFDH